MDLIFKIFLTIVSKIWEWFSNLNDIWQITILLSIGVILTILVLYIAIKIEEFFFYKFPKKSKKRKKS
jgi:hypothetical protein